MGRLKNKRYEKLCINVWTFNRRGCHIEYYKTKMVKQSPDTRGSAGLWGLPSNENIMKAGGEMARVDADEKQRFKQRGRECRV